MHKKSNICTNRYTCANNKIHFVRIVRNTTVYKKSCICTNRYTYVNTKSTLYGTPLCTKHSNCYTRKNNVKEYKLYLKLQNTNGSRYKVNLSTCHQPAKNINWKLNALLICFHLILCFSFTCFISLFITFFVTLFIFFSRFIFSF